MTGRTTFSSARSLKRVLLLGVYKELTGLSHRRVLDTEPAPRKEAGPARLCIAFHSDWMKRGPDENLERDALRRRESFPVAVVVVVHDDISLMRATLEEVAMVVEFIVSVNSRCTCW